MNFCQQRQSDRTPACNTPLKLVSRYGPASVPAPQDKRGKQNLIVPTDQNRLRTLGVARQLISIPEGGDSHTTSLLVRWGNQDA
jgi:hypothetical protein